ncbi:hypothetical protein DLH72_01205 [Candidatus Gracilibacteria bacterium]|nr:MAG: hypothetical protein DLH72_01205 [Candidatus Gracilibacteria bacterium]
MKKGEKNNNFKHGLTKTKIWYIWCSMKGRCNNPNNKDYKRYGGRGIKYDKKWEDFLGFYSDMGETYKDGLELDRIDNNGNYCKENCRWTTRKTQNRNSSNCRYYKGKCISEWCEELGLNYSTVRSRINQSKWSIKKALNLI